MIRILGLIFCLSGLRASPILYSYRTPDGGGIARLEIHPESGDLLHHERLIEDPGLTDIYKIAVSDDGAFLAATREEVEDRDNLVIVPKEGSHRLLSFRDEVDEIAFHSGFLYVGTTKGRVYRIDPATGRTLHTWNFRDLLTPSARRPEDFFFDDTHGVLWISFQKDSKKRKHLGSRIAAVDLASGQVIADLQLPRNRPELHYPPEVDGRESGPNPEVIFVDPASNTLFVTLDLYGAVGMADLDAALRGELNNWTVHSTAPDGSWGTAFPDRVGSFLREGRTYLLVANSGEEGGTTVVDLHQRRVSTVLDSPHGLTTLHDVPRAGVIVSGNSGKLKRRGSGGLDKETLVSTHWVHFTGPPEDLKVNTRSFPFPVHRVAPVDLQHSPLVVINVQTNADQWIVVDPRAGDVLQPLSAFGRVQRTVP